MACTVSPPTRRAISTRRKPTAVNACRSSPSRGWRPPEEARRPGGPGPRVFGVNPPRGFYAFHENPNPPIVLAQPPFVVLIVGVLPAIPVARRPRHNLGDRRPFPGEQKSMFVFE